MSWFIEVLKKYAVFSGRARRKEYWMYMLFVAIIYIVLAAIGFAAKMTWLPLIFWVGILLPSLGVTIRRLHDTGRSGWWFLFGFVPLVGGITLFVFSLLDSEPSENKYGPNPKGFAPAHV
ncbi:DUF805 domain-containing protein [Streptomyces sp. SID13726]|uniref:DUF805 domain-containing protein n=1 Tax=Streptomyces sp. SID13726 TaxID=2706058 RepID=UPI0013BE4FD3|nr:DUF805 domain-containing protein [Streptomyces sp. SID13726]NEB00190.1 DUF805 domain-containing protein [Streptomyces sp. SID13726]